MAVNDVLFWGSLGLGIFFIYTFFSGKKGMVSPSRLRLNKPVRGMVLKGFGTKTWKDERMKSLNVIFMFNGHSFDAYEVLGLVPGSSYAQAEAAYAAAKKKEGHELPLLDAAMEAIREENRTSGKS